MQYEERATWKRYNAEIVQSKKLQHEKITIQKSATWKRGSMKHEKSAT